MEGETVAEKKRPEKLSLIVAIGASAGGLDPLRRFLSMLPPDFGFALVFIQHLSSKYKNLAGSLLQSRRPDMEIVEIADGQEIAPGRLYLCPPGQDVKMKDGIFHFTPLPAGHTHLPIDEFFSSLAEDAGYRATAVIFSGSGTDGARGIHSIRINGGNVFVQDPATAEFPGMPLAAINTGQVDAVLPPEEIAREILKVLAAGMIQRGAENLIPAQELESFFRLIQDKAGYRLDHYKKSVVSRRIRRRMYLHGIPSFDAYIRMLAEHTSEALLLASDIMIGVTSFFRDQAAWNILKTDIIKGLGPDNDDLPLRVWVPACATGEEAYSITMLLCYEFEVACRRKEIQVFATDLNDRALEKAREGKYPASVVSDIPPDYLRNFCTCSEDGLFVHINKEVRERVVFARQDLLTDPPFSRLDLVICRNLLIYLEPDAQEKCIAIFHYALKEGGYLFLGNAESTNRNSALFKSLGHKKARLYQKLEARPATRLPLAVPLAAERSNLSPARQATAGQKESLVEFIQSALLEDYAPAAVAIDQNYDILYHNGATNKYLRPPRGTPTQNLIELLPDNLGRRLRGGIYRAMSEVRPIVLRAGIVGVDERKRQLIIRISKLKENLLLVAFQEKGALPEETADVHLEGAAVEETVVRQMEKELQKTRDALQSNIEQLKSLNEELQSSNEELQAANEELETSREELQSLNEELITVNNQLQGKIEEQEETNNDLNNFLASTSIPTLFLDHQFKLRRFTPAMAKLLKLLPSDVGRTITDMSQESLGPELIADAQTVLDHLVPVKKEMVINGAWYIRTTLPYRTVDNRIEGAVIAYIDVTEQKETEGELRRQAELIAQGEKVRGHLSAIVQSADDAIISEDLGGLIQTWNIGAEKMFGYTAAEAAGRDISFLVPPGQVDEVPDILQRIVQDKHIDRYETLRRRKDGTTITVSLTFSAIRDNEGEVVGLSCIAHDISESKRAAERMRHLASFPQLNPNPILELDLAGKPVFINPAAKRILASLGLGEADAKVLLPEDFDETLQALKNRDDKVLYREFGVRDRIFGATLHLIQWFNVVRLYAFDITDRKRAEQGRDLTGDFLQLVNRSTGLAHLVREATAFFHSHSGCEATGIRLREGDDYPYYGTQGFPEEFVRLESSLSAKDADGNVIHDSSGNPLLDCLCGSIICGRFDPARYFFTKGGSFWTNSTTELLAETTAADHLARARNRCHGEGYESVMLIPLCVGQERLGLLQLNDRRRGMFSPEAVALWERLAGHLAVALSKFRTEEQLRKSEEHAREQAAQLQALLDAVPVMIWIARDRDCSVVTGNRATYEFLGVPEGTDLSMTGTAPEKLGHYRIFKDGVELAPREMPIQQVCGHGQGFNEYALEIHFAGGAVRSLIGNVTPIFDHHGQPAGAVSAFLDVTEFKQFQKDLERSLHRFELLAATAGELLQAPEPQKVVESLCRQVMEYLDCQAFFNFLADEQAGRLHLNAYAGIPEEEARRIEWLDYGVAVCGCAARDVRPIVAEHIPTTADERTELVKSFGIKAYACHPFLGPGGKVMGTLSFGTRHRETFSEDDLSLMKAITDQVAMALNRMSIEQDLRQRTHQLESVNQELEAFIYSASHDLRSPLRNMGGFATFLLDDYAGKLDDRGRDYLNRIKQNTARMSQLISDLLDLSRLSKEEFVRTSINMSELASTIVANLRETHPHRRVDVAIADNLTARADPRLMELVLINLFDNAWKFTCKTAQAAIEFGSCERKGQTIYYVKDNGAGFDPQYGGKMFAPFHRLHSDAEFEGTGIGLTIVERIIRRHGGRVWAEAEVGRGATIYFTLS